MGKLMNKRSVQTLAIINTVLFIQQWLAMTKLKESSKVNFWQRYQIMDSTFNNMVYTVIL